MNLTARTFFNAVAGVAALGVFVGVLAMVSSGQIEDTGVQMCKTMAKEFPERARNGDPETNSLDEYNDMRRGFQDSHIPVLQKSGVAFVDQTYVAAVDDPSRLPVRSQFVVAAYSRLSVDCKTYAGTELPSLAELSKLRQESIN